MVVSTSALSRLVVARHEDEDPAQLLGWAEPFARALGMSWVEVDAGALTGAPVRSGQSDGVWYPPGTGPRDVLLLGRGARRRGWMGPGGTNDHVIMHAACPVVVVPPGAVWPADEDAPVVVALDGHSSLHARRTATRLALLLHRPLVAVSVVDSLAPAGLGGVQGLAARAREVHEEALLQELVSIHAEEGYDLPVLARVLEGRAANALLRAAESATLLVLGSRGRGGFRGLLLGSTSRAVARQAPVPVMIVREDPDLPVTD